MVKAEREVTFAQIWLQPERLECFGMRLLLPGLGWLVEMIEVAYRGREARVRESELWVEFNRLVVKIYR